MVSRGVFAATIVVVAVVLFLAGYFTYPIMNPAPQKTPQKASVWEEIKKRGYIVVATSPDWPPFEYIDPKTNKIVGYEVDLMNAIAKKLGLKVKWKPMSFDSIIAAVKNGEVDLGVSGFSITPERCKEVLFTIYHDVTEAQLIMLEKRAKELGITRLKSLDEIAKYHLVVGTGSGTTEEEELLDLVKKGVISSSQVKSYPDFGAALKDLEAGSIDAIYAETPVTTWWISTEPVKLVVVYSKPYWPVAFIANKNAQELVSRINGVLAEMIASGELDQIKAKWNVTTPP
ncbi:MAG: transporter substrate-binding domain-containing protein [Pyrodictiaceae archaeon]